MELTEAQLDALKEIANIGISRAATQLSLLLSDKIVMNVPNARITLLSEASKTLNTTDEDMAVVYQDLSGELAGRAHLVLNTEESKVLVHALLGNVPTLSGADLLAYEHEAMTEIGNIVISTCISTLGNLLDGEIFLTVPTYSEKSALDMFAGGGKAKDVLIMETVLKATNKNVEGMLVLVLTLESATDLLDMLSGLLDS